MPIDLTEGLCSLDPGATSNATLLNLSVLPGIRQLRISISPIHLNINAEKSVAFTAVAETTRIFSLGSTLKRHSA